MQMNFLQTLMILWGTLCVLNTHTQALEKCADIQKHCEDWFNGGDHPERYQDTKKRAESTNTMRNGLCGKFGDTDGNPPSEAAVLCQKLWVDQEISWEQLCAQCTKKMKEQNTWIILHNSGIAQKITEGENPIPGLKPKQEAPIPLLCLEN